MATGGSFPFLFYKNIKKVLNYLLPCESHQIWFALKLQHCCLKIQDQWMIHLTKLQQLLYKKHIMVSTIVGTASVSISKFVKNNFLNVIMQCSSFFIMQALLSVYFVIFWWAQSVKWRRAIALPNVFCWMSKCYCKIKKTIYKQIKKSKTKLEIVSYMSLL